MATAGAGSGAVLLTPNLVSDRLNGRDGSTPGNRNWWLWDSQMQWGGPARPTNSQGPVYYQLGRVSAYAITKAQHIPNTTTNIHLYASRRGSVGGWSSAWLTVAAHPTAAAATSPPGHAAAHATTPQSSGYTQSPSGCR